MPVLQDVIDQAALNSSITVRLSGMSLTVLLSAFDYLRNIGQWYGVNYWPDQAEIDTIDEIVSEAYNQIMTNARIGEVFWAARDDVPENCLRCDGTVYQQADYPELMAVLADNFKLPDGTFYTPQIAGRAPIGAGQGHLVTDRPRWTFGGVESVTLTEAQMPAHTHSYTPPVTDIDLEDIGGPTLAAAVGLFPASTGSTGGSQAHENMMPWAAVPYFIVVR